MAPQNQEDPASPLTPQNWKQLQRFMPAIKPNGYFSKTKNIEFEYHSFSQLLDSSQFNIGHWQQMATEIERRYNDFDGFIIIHGTDTMAYTASALSFVFENLTKPIVLTGSQLPISHTRTDAVTNFSNAIHIAASSAFGLPVINEVSICFNDKVFRGNRCTKASTNDFEGFTSPNYPALAELEESIKVNTKSLWQNGREKFNCNSNFNPNVLVLTLFPGIRTDLLTKLVEDSDVDGIIIKTFGSGNAPCSPQFLDVLKNAKDQGTFVMFITQCLQGSVHLGKYAASNIFKEIGVISGYDITTEAALSKMMWVLAQKITKKEQEKLLLSNIRGEITI